MSRLIDGDKLLETYKKWIPQLSSKNDEGDKRGVETCITVLEDTPTIDAVEVVRCKDCKHRDNCNLMTDDDFCSDRERKEDTD